MHILSIKYGLLGSEKSTLKMVVASHQLLMGEPGYDLDIQTISEQVLYNVRVRRGYNPRASQQHQAATLASGSRYEDLARLEVPTLIIHGTSDPFIPIDHGRKCAQVIPGARTLWVEGMGHDQPRVFVKPAVGAMLEHFERARSGFQGSTAGSSTMGLLSHLTRGRIARDGDRTPWRRLGSCLGRTWEPFLVRWVSGSLWCKGR